MTRLSIIVLTYNTQNLTLACLSSLVAQYKDQLESGAFEIILVDNASSDNTVATINEQRATNKKWIKLVHNDQNYGFSKGNNIGVAHAKGTYLLFLNSDTTVHDNQLSAMVQYFDEHASVGVLGGKLTDPTGQSEHTARTFYDITDVIFMLFGGERFLKKFTPHHIAKVDWVSGGCMMTPKKLFEKLGGFDEHLFMYTEDMEYCYRVKKTGFFTYYFPDIAITHRGQGSANRSFAIIHIYQGLLYFYKKHKSNMEYRVVKFLLAAKAYSAIGIGYLTNNTYLKSTYTKTIHTII